MKKFNLKKSAKYIICTLLTLTVVATVVFLPRFYYSVTDNRDSVGNTAETFKLTADITTSSGGEFLKLVSNEDQATFRSFLHLTAAAVTNLQCVEHLTVM